MKAVILAAGKSTRTYPLTVTRPKPLLPVANKALLARQLDALAGLVDEAILVVGYRQEMIRERFGERYGEIRLTYVEQTEQLGTGHAVLQCAAHLDGPVLVLNGDDLYAPEDLRALVSIDQGCLGYAVEDPRRFGVLETEGDRLVRVVEKPERPTTNIASIGAYKFPGNVCEILQSAKPSARGEIEIVAAMQALADQGRFWVVKATGYWLPIGYPWDLIAANEWWLENRFEARNEGEVSSAAHLSGPVAVGRGTLIKAGAVIEGPVAIGEDCTIGPNCWLRPGTSIGNGCKVGQGVEIKNSVIMAGAAVPHLTYVGDSVVGEKANLGCGTITANFRHDGKNHRSMVKGELVDTGRRKLGAIIGDHVHTGINTSIYPGRKLWPHTSTLPGEVVERDKES